MAARLSKLDKNSSSGQDAANAIVHAAENQANAGRFEKFSGGGHGQGWRILENGKEVAKGSVPMNSHGEKNLVAALDQLIKAVEHHHIAD